MLVRRNSNPAFTSCLPTFQEKFSMNWLLVSTRARESPEVAPGWAKKLVPLGVPETRMMGRPESCMPEPEQSATELAAHKPIELGWKFMSWGKKPSANRFHP